jgi:hypothetical protein
LHGSTDEAASTTVPRTSSHAGAPFLKMRFTGRLLADGCRSTNVCGIEGAINPVRGRPDFRLLIMDLGMPDDRFARAE